MQQSNPHFQLCVKIEAVFIAKSIPLMKLLFSLAWIVTLLASSVQAVPSALILSGASQTAKYLPLLEQKRVALVANNSSQVAGQSIIAVLLEHKINLVKVFSPEHGFDGRSDAGAKVTNTQASAKQIAIISLYGAKNKPTAADLADVDIIVFDLQDVGVRFYTYISSLQKIM